MPSDPRPPSIAMGPGIPPLRASAPVPSFGADPDAWFAHVDALLSVSPELVRDLGPSDHWIDDEGHRWRAVATIDGPEVRPGLENPFLVVGGPNPIVSALLITPTALHAELTMRKWRHVTTFAVGSVPLRDLGVATLMRYEFPHEALDRVNDEVWADARARWHRAVLASTES